ncbi:MAG TPA: ATP-binding protein [Caulobacteraceae bacterium]|nr:ATP-binding protein [Caulobacteraceae bacterium]
MSAAVSKPASTRPGLSFQTRITAVAMITAVTVLVAACAAFIAEQWRAEQTAQSDQQTVVAEVFAAGPTAAAGFRDPNKADAGLARLQARYPALAAVYLLDLRGKVVGRYGAADPAASRAAGLAEARAPVRIDGRAVGEIVTFNLPHSVWAILPRYLALAAALFFAAGGLALVLGRWLAGRVTDPVNRLSQAMQAVADSGDFAQRVERADDDELGRLTDSFNGLLSKLNHNDQALRRTMSELVDARDSAQSANRLKSQFLANMSHEIRTPLNGLLAMTQVMALEPMGETQRGRLDIIRQSGEALLGILNDILDVSKIEAGKLELEVGPFDVETAFRTAHDAFAPVADRKGVALALDVGATAAGRRLGDAARLGQIVNNLVSNALKFTHAGEVRIAVDGLGEDGGDGIRVRVSDTGIGISPEAAPLLFQRFTQADSSTTRRFGGAGLGLAICQELAQLMGGRIGLESREGQGSTFEVELPLPRIAAPVAAAVSAEPPRFEAEDRLMRVLAAEDNATNQLVLTTVMDVFGVDLTLVGDGRQAVDAWRDGDFDLILMDIQMPEMDGLTATRNIRAAEAQANRKRVPIIALSAHAMTHQVQEYLSAGVDLHVPKPIELPKLRAAMAQALALDAEAGAGAAAA